MVVRKDGWRLIASVAVCLTAAGALMAGLPTAMARDLREPPRPRADVPFPQDMMTTGATQPTLVWGGPLPPEPIPGEAPVYVPSRSVVPSRAEPQPQFAPPEDFQAEPEPQYQSPRLRRAARPQPETQPEPEDMLYETEPQYRPAEEIYRATEPLEEPLRSADEPDYAGEPQPADDALRLPQPSEDAPSPRAGSRFEEPAGGYDAPPPEPSIRRQPQRRATRSGLPSIDDEGMATTPLYQATDAAPDPRLRDDPASDLDARMGGYGDALPPLGDPTDIDGDTGLGTSGYAPVPRTDPWAGLTDVTPGAALAAPAMAAPRQAPILEGRVGRSRPRSASLEGRTRPRIRANEGGGKRSIFDFGRGALEQETPTGYSRMPQSEALCRVQLQKLGVKFVDASSIKSSRSCGIDYPVKIHDIAPGIAMRPSATLNCEAALRVAQWMKDEVKPAARWKMLKTPTVVINASSYRCSRIAGSRSVSQHATGSALDIRGFKFSDGSIMEVEKKGLFDFREKAFQTSVRQSACEYFGTVLGPGYNEDHADHLHLDTKQRRRGVCK